jgi:putative acetyltransferase
MKLIRTTSENPDFITLVRELDQYLAGVNGEAHGFFAQFNKIDMLKHAVVAYIDETPVGCGAFKAFDTTAAEIKRMFVQPAFRGKGIASAILKELETWAAEEGFTACVLETGSHMPDAVALYAARGYNVTAKYGQYVDSELSVCMRKDV